MGKKINKTKVSGLFLADQLGKGVLDSVRNTAGSKVGYVYGYCYNQPGVKTRFTTGLNVSPVLGGNYQLAFTGACYYQGGHDKGGLKLNACMIKLAASYIPGEKSYTAG